MSDSSKHTPLSSFLSWGSCSVGLQESRAVSSGSRYTWLDIDCSLKETSLSDDKQWRARFSFSEQTVGCGLLLTVLAYHHLLLLRACSGFKLPGYRGQWVNSK